MKLFWLNEAEIIKQVRQEYDIWLQSVDKLRKIREDDKVLFFDADVDNKKIQVRTILQWHRMKMAIYYKNKPKIEWARRRSWDTDRAKNVNRAMLFDYKEMWMEIVDYLTQDAISKVWVGINVSGRFNIDTVCPKIENIDPLKWIPDPMGWPTIEDHRWCGFESNYMQKWQMKKLWFANIDEATPRDYVRSEQAQDNANAVVQTSDDSPNKEFDVYLHMFQSGGKKYQVYMNGDKTTIHLLEHLKPVTLEEKKNETLIPFPVMLKYGFYIPNMPFGLSTADLLRDTQSNLSKLYNLYIAMVYRNTFGGDRLVRAGELEDPDSLNTPSIEGKDITIKDTNRSLNDIIMEIPREQTTQMQNNMIDILKRNGSESLGAESTQQWVLSDSNKTLGEQEMAAKNANLQFALEEKVMLWWESFKWKYLWYRPYLANMKSSEVKDISLSEWVTREFFAFKKDEFVGREMLALEVVSSSDMQQDSSNKAEKAVILQGLIAGATSEGEKRKYYRMWAEISDFSDVQIQELLGKTADEVGAEKKLAQINEGMEEWAVVDSMDDDHQVYIRYIQTADPSKLKDDAMDARYEAIKLKAEEMNGMAGQVWAEQAGASANSAMMTSSMLQWGSQVATNLWT